MFDWVSNRPWLLVRNKEINDLIGKTGIECESPVFRNFKQTLHYYALYMIVSHFFTGSSFVAVVLDRFFSLGRQNRNLVLDEWSSYGGGLLSRFDCIYIYIYV